MLSVSRREFSETLSRRGGAIDLALLSPELKGVLESAGVSAAELADIAGDDGVIRAEELDALFEELTGGSLSGGTGHRNGDILRTDQLWSALRSEVARQRPDTVVELPRRQTGLRQEIRNERREEPRPQAGEHRNARAIADRMAAREISPANLEAFELFEAANERAESGGSAGFSGLRTTGGAPAAYGHGQLNIREHLDTLHDLPDSDLTELGIERSALEAARTRGNAAQGWYRIANDAWNNAPSTTRGRSERNLANAASGLSEADARHLRALTEAGDWAAIEHLYGERFQATTGLPASELPMLAQTSRLMDRELRAQWRATFHAVNGHAFSDGGAQRRSPRGEMELATAALLAAHPELSDLHERLGTQSMGYYLGVGRSGENLNGWYHAAANTALPEGELDALVIGASPVSTRDRQIYDFNRALPIVDATAASGGERAELLARVARQWHASPRAANNLFMQNGQPRHRDVESLRGALDGLRGDAAISDAGIRRHLRNEGQR